MHIRKKQLLGFFGLVVVAAITAIASTIPSPNVNAATSAELEIRVVVTNNVPSVEITAPTGDGTDSTPTIKTTYNNATGIEYYLVYTDGTGDHEVLVETFTPTVDPNTGIASGTHDVTVNLNNYAGYGEYTIKAVVTGPEFAEDTRNIRFLPIIPEYIGTDEDNNPEFTIDSDDGVGSVHIQVYPKNPDGSRGDPVFVDDIVANLPITNDEITVLLTDAGVDTGDYIVDFTPYGTGGTSDTPIYDPYTLIVPYTKPGSPEVPNTGAFFSQLGLSKQDTIITSLIAFFGTAFFAIILLCRKNNNQRRRR